MTKTSPFGLVVEARLDDLSVTTLPVSWLRGLVDEHLLVVLRGFRGFASSEEFGRYSATWGPLLEWNFGTVLEVKEDPSTVDTVFDSSCIPLHWDAMFNQIAPQYIIFEGIRSPGPRDGGRTTFCDTNAVLRKATEEQRARWRRTTVTYSVKRLAHYGGTVTSRLVEPHPLIPGREVIRFGEPEADDVRLKNPVTRVYDAPDYARVQDMLDEVQAALNDPDCFYAHPWRDGDILISDNYSLLHGREAFTAHSFRHLRRTQVLATPPHRNLWHP